MEANQILLIPATIIGSVVLIVSCLSFKRFKRKPRNESSSVSDKNKPGKTKREENSKINGITNTAFTVENGGKGIHENDTNVYDYAKNDRGMERKHGPWSKGQQKYSDTSPVYADADDTNTRFYFTLERSHDSNRVIDEDDGAYVIVIPENIYDKPEDDKSIEPQTNATSGSQFYYTLEECSQQNESDKELSSQNAVPKENNDFTDDTTDETPENGIQAGISIEIEEHDEMSDDDTYVISIPNDGMNYKLSGTDIENHRDTLYTENEDTDEPYVVNIPNDKNESLKASKSDEYTRQTEIEEDNDDGYSGQLGVEKENVYRQKRTNSRSEEDKFGNDVDTHDTEEIYENASTCSHPKEKRQVPSKILSEESSRHVKNAKNSEESTITADSQENLGYLDDEILTQSTTKENAKQNAIDENPYVIQVNTLANDCLSENIARNDNQYYFDDDIYEDWEDNIIGRIKKVSGEFGDNLNESGDELNESEDEIYQNKNFDVIKERDRVSGCESFYENLRDFRPSLVMHDIR